MLLGGDSEIANNFSVDPRTGRLWIAATARDGEDGQSDGVSELGALYRFDVVRASGGGWQISEVCHRSFPGGSASTPTLGQNGTRVYLGDDVGSLIAVDAEDCSEAWSVPLGSKIFGSVSASSDGREIYASSAVGIFQVFDDGDHGRRGWTAALDVYDIPPSLANYTGVNLLLVGAGANGLLIQVGAGTRTPDGQSIPVRTGIAHVDRGTGEPRWFTDGLEESLAAMSTGPDGSLYLSHAPLRRAFALALGSTTEPLIGGISKWGATRHDLLARDAACAAADRAENALAFQSGCPESARADVDQVGALRDQVATAVAHAVADGDLDRGTGARVARLATQVGISPGDDADTYVGRFLRRAESALGEACRLLSASADNPGKSACSRMRLAADTGAAGSGSSARKPADRCRTSLRLAPRR